MPYSKVNPKDGMCDSRLRTGRKKECKMSTTSTWTPEKIARLREMCASEKTNAAIAADLCVPIEKIYAKRSQFGITIAKCAETTAPASNQNDIEARVHKDVMKRRKTELLHKLLGIVRTWEPNVEALSLERGGDFVKIRFSSGSSKSVSIEADSMRAIVLDVIRAIQ